MTSGTRRKDSNKNTKRNNHVSIYVVIKNSASSAQDSHTCQNFSFISHKHFK
uniref:Uncharacterized protein n=1 Tax=Rhizophora mucronata TaxID=61149 RepID=A0A2P2QCJ2_RHIMU